MTRLILLAGLTLSGLSLTACGAAAGRALRGEDDTDADRAADADAAAAPRTQ
jgi:hypothetical protein